MSLDAPTGVDPVEAARARHAAVRRRGPWRRLALRWGFAIEHRLVPVMARHAMTGPMLHRIRDSRWFGFLEWRRVRRPYQPWAPVTVDPPADLATGPGVKRDPIAEREAYEKAPLQEFLVLHEDMHLILGPHFWRSYLPNARRLLKARRAGFRTGKVVPPVEPPAEVDPVELAARLKEKALELGLSTVGIAEFDPKYTFAQHVGKAVGDRMLVCVVEQPYEETQLSPSTLTERAVLGTYAEQGERMLALAAWLHEQGYRARVEDNEGENIMIHYGVATGLGQLGLNGQLLTPQAGSRCRLAGITTNAPLAVDSPRDYGLEGVCNECQVCVRRCPVGAIPAVRKEHRGITKAKLNTKRCWPLMSQVNGCAICIKTCPVQAYGLEAVVAEYERSGRIIGKGTDGLEGYDWPIDGRHYGPGESPRVPEWAVHPEGWSFDPKRQLPIVAVTSSH